MPSCIRASFTAAHTLVKPFWLAATVLLAVCPHGSHTTHPSEKSNECASLTINKHTMVDATMKAVVVREFGGTDVLTVEDTVVPIPQAGQVLVKLEFAGVNPVDTYIRTGTYAIKPSLPSVSCVCVCVFVCVCTSACGDVSCHMCAHEHAQMFRVTCVHVSMSRCFVSHVRYVCMYLICARFLCSWVLPGIHVHICEC